jgi:hypothetical protein
MWHFKTLSNRKIMALTMPRKSAGGKGKFGVPDNLLRFVPCRC